ncbi:Protein arginine N-methyltransferase 5 [Vanrija pseudolonga]|uniref:Protein arginine N-methyltransferase n=1 Tax=Vanrija pseudolonga TaxID=143232 RepID=A0AAF1BTI0_9TREE|nr:Protein arginine N-methyltransferase 5 [Vanrija pseudolonga]
MPLRLPIAVVPRDIPKLPTKPHPAPSPLQAAIGEVISETDYDVVCLPLANDRWRERWDRLCLRPVDEEEDAMLDAYSSADSQAATERSQARADVDREADLWRREPSLRRDECNITRLEESQAVIALASDWLELDAPDEGIRFDSELGLRAEMAQALYLSLPVLVIPAPNLANRAFLPSYARAISNILQMGGQSAYTQISIRIPVSDPLEIIGQGPAGASNGEPRTHHRRVSSLSSRPSSMHQQQLNALGPLSAGGQPSGGYSNGGSRNVSGASAQTSGTHASGVSSKSMTHSAIQGDPSSTWEMWDCIRAMCGYNPRLTITLDLSNPLPPSVGALSRWTSEPVKHIWLPATAFIPNAKGFPVLSKACQAFIRGMTKQAPTFILSECEKVRHPSGGAAAYPQYVRHITSQPTTSGANISPQGPEEVANGYGDFLQAPLQPLMDDLGSATYDVFERDPVKYRQYEEAIYLAIVEKAAEGNDDLVIVIAGAGRGPLVACTLRALARAQLEARVYAVEKNPSAFTTLEERKALEWGHHVEIVFGDMRTLPVTDLADILVSELLGSFGDNELSPECIDGGMRFLKADGVSIPTSYTAHIAPISSSKLHHDVTQPSRAAGAAETPYVVMMQQVNLLSGEGGGVSGRCGERIQQCWQFEHPRRDLILDYQGLPYTNSHNTRSATLTFHIPHASPCHGFAGYFEAHLYGNVGLSIHPDTAARVSPEMFSWFPLFFPLKQPLYLPSGAELEVNIWRLADTRARKVWYEWSAEAYLPVTSQAATHLGTPRLRAPATPGLSSDASPTQDAPYSPREVAASSAPDPGRVKIGQTTLHNAGGVHYWVGL